MSIFSRRRSRAPDHIRRTLLQLREALAASLEGNLTALIVYGDYLKPELFDGEHSQVNLMIVLREIDCSSLDRMTAPINTAERQIPLTTMTMTADDIRTSCDVFPIKFHDMQLHHRLLYGEDVLSGLEISSDHLRLRCEQELKNMMIRLRAIYLHQSRNDKLLLQTLADTSHKFLRCLNACLTAKSAVIPEGAADLIEAFGTEFGLDTTVVPEVLDLCKSRRSLPTLELKQVFDQLMRLIHDAAQAVDQLECAS
jgi:hypothetical protein